MHGVSSSSGIHISCMIKMSLTNRDIMAKDDFFHELRRVRDKRLYIYIKNI